ncbi:MAG: DASH family cryptochrome, partial [Leucothrix sp.]
ECGYCEQLQETGISQFCELDIVGGTTLLDINTLPTEPASIPNSYVLFRRVIESNWDEQAWAVPACCEPPKKLPPAPENLNLASTETNPVTDSRAISNKAVIAFNGGEQAGLARLNTYMWCGKGLESYKETRNQLLGSDYSSKLSPWLANGCLSPRQVYHEIRRFEQDRVQNESTRWLICQLLWRDYYHFASYKHGPDLFLGGGMRGQNTSKKKISITADAIQSWCNGTTGQRFVDANMTELLETGYIGNRGRQSVSLYLVRDLGLDWRLGASWFEHYLLDFEPCNNYGNWNFQAGIGHDIKKCNGFKIDVEAQKHDPQGHYQAYWLD